MIQEELKVTFDINTIDHLGVKLYSMKCYNKVVTEVANKI